MLTLSYESNTILYTNSWLDAQFTSLNKWFHFKQLMTITCEFTTWLKHLWRETGFVSFRQSKTSTESHCLNFLYFSRYMDVKVFAYNETYTQVLLVITYDDRKGTFVNSPSIWDEIFTAFLFSVLKKCSQYCVLCFKNLFFKYWIFFNKCIWDKRSE